MLCALRKLDRRLGLLMGLFVVLAFAMPAFEAHACPAEAVPVVAVADAVEDGAPACPDCGPSCANGCCHTAHVAVQTESTPTKAVLRIDSAAPWGNAAPSPSRLPSGPERPPRA